jgi:hypothetical protein
MELTIESDTLVLTDDEVAAVALSLRCAWPTAMPTIPDAADALLDAARRGRRALAVRGLLEQSAQGEFGTLPERVLPGLAEALAGGLRWGVLTTDDDLGALLTGPSFYHYGEASSDDWITDVVRPDGVHRLAATPRADCRELLVAMVESTWADVPDDDPTAADSWLCILGPRSVSRVVLVGSGQLRRHVLHDGTAERIEDASSVAEALTWLGITD